jgi:hypothetical protein
LTPAPHQPDIKENLMNKTNATMGTKGRPANATMVTQSPLANVTRIYVGQDRVCRCGCKGTYAEAGTPLFTRRLRQMERLLNNGAERIVGATYLNLSYGNDRALCAYYD